mgnify:CR=1 FL=1
MSSFRTVLFCLLALLLFVPLILYSPDATTKYVRELFDLYPDPVPAREALPERKVLAQSLQEEILIEDVATIRIFQVRCRTD